MNRGREAWPQEKEDKEVVLLCTADGEMLDRGTCRHYELVSPFRGSLSSLGTRVNHETREGWWVGGGGGGYGNEVMKYLCTDVERPGVAYEVPSKRNFLSFFLFFLWLVRFLKAARQCQSRGSLLREPGLLRVSMSGIFSSANDRWCFWCSSVFGVCSDR